MIGSIMQPTFNPWIGYFDMIDQSDVFVLYDDVQLTKRSWQVRNRIKTVSGELFLTVPIKKTKHRDDLLIAESFIDSDHKWKRKHLASILNAYGKSLYFDQVYTFLEEFYDRGIITLGTFNGKMIIKISKQLGIDTQIVFSSEMKEIIGHKDERLLSICKKMKIDSYLSAQGSSDYIEAVRQGGALAAGGVEVYYHFYNYPKYTQLYGDFISHLGVFDMLFNVGFEKGLMKIREGRTAPVESKEYRTKFIDTHD